MPRVKRGVEANRRHKKILKTSQRLLRRAQSCLPCCRSSGH